MEKPVIIFGAATLAELVFEILIAQNRHVVGATADRFPDTPPKTFDFLGLYSQLELDFESFDFCVCVGDNRGRMEVMNRISLAGGHIANAVHPQSFVSQSARVGVGNIIFPMAYIGSYVIVGDGNVVFPFVSLTHHSTIGDFTFFAPNASVGGQAKIGNFAKLGMNSTIVANSILNEGVHIPPGEVYGGTE